MLVLIRVCEMVLKKLILVSGFPFFHLYASYGYSNNSFTIYFSTPPGNATASVEGRNGNGSVFRADNLRNSNVTFSNIVLGSSYNVTVTIHFSQGENCSVDLNNVRGNFYLKKHVYFLQRIFSIPSRA